jgi:cytochrome c oxidase cbb3-type subunit 3
MTVGRVAMAVLAIGLLAGCDSLPGKPTESDRPINPSQVKSFAALYGENCAGCHGAGGSLGAACDLANPTYQALVDDATLTRIVSQGVAGTAMPPFAEDAGGFLSAAQVAIVVNGMRGWKTGAPLQNAPPYAAAGGDAGRGAGVFAQSCAPCHGPQGTGGPKASGSIVEPSYLMLVSDQALRTLIIAGRPDLGHPDWRGYPPGQPLTAQQVADVVALLASKRTRFVPGNYASNP